MNRRTPKVCLDTPAENRHNSEPSSLPRENLPMLADLVRLARPQHWIKNAFVLLPVPFALAANAGAGFTPTSFLLGLAGFCS